MHESARPDLCGGPRATGVPTAISGEGLAAHSCREPCVGYREVSREASVAD